MINIKLLYLYQEKINIKVLRTQIYWYIIILGLLLNTEQPNDKQHTTHMFNSATHNSKKQSNMFLNYFKN